MTISITPDAVNSRKEYYEWLIALRDSVVTEIVSILDGEGEETIPSDGIDHYVGEADTMIMPDWSRYYASVDRYSDAGIRRRTIVIPDMDPHRELAVATRETVEADLEPMVEEKLEDQGVEVY